LALPVLLGAVPARAIARALHGLGDRRAHLVMALGLERVETAVGAELERRFDVRAAPVLEHVIDRRRRAVGRGAPVVVTDRLAARHDHPVMLRRGSGWRGVDA